MSTPRLVLAGGCAVVLTAVATGLVGRALVDGSSRRAAIQTNPRRGEAEGRAPRPRFGSTPGVPATFLRDGYRPGQLASLVLWRREPAFDVRFFRVSRTDVPRWTYTTMQGKPVTAVRRLRGEPAHTRIRLGIGNWPSGVYFARLYAGGRVGFAPFVLAPRRLGAHDVLVVEPTFTWQAYNYRDDNRDGVGDTWYAGHGQTSVRLHRPYLSRGVPPHFTVSDLPFLTWLEQAGKQADFMSDSQFAAVRNGRALARAYKLIIFPGHHEYVTTHEYDLTKRYRDLGGHLMFLSANNFFWKVVRHGDRLVRVEQWRRLGRPESALIGVQYLRGDGGRHQGRWVVRNTKRFPWLFGSSGLHLGSKFGYGGIEIDHTTRHSPPGTTVVADMRNLMPHGGTAQMTFYTTSRGAKVFAAGAFTLGGASDSGSYHVVLNLWNRLTESR